MQQTIHTLDPRGTIEREKALAVRNAYLALLRAFEDMYDLPRSVPTKVERGERDAKQEHHNR
jgi:hypothetical protein